MGGVASVGAKVGLGSKANPNGAGGAPKPQGSGAQGNQQSGANNQRGNDKSESPDQGIGAALNELSKENESGDDDYGGIFGDDEE